MSARHVSDRPVASSRMRLRGCHRRAGRTSRMVAALAVARESVQLAVRFDCFGRGQSGRRSHRGTVRPHRGNRGPRSSPPPDSIQFKAQFGQRAGVPCETAILCWSRTYATCDIFLHDRDHVRVEVGLRRRWGNHVRPRQRVKFPLLEIFGPLLVDARAGRSFFGTAQRANDCCDGGGRGTAGGGAIWRSPHQAVLQ